MLKVPASAIDSLCWSGIAWCIGLLFVFLKHLQLLTTSSYLSVQRMLPGASSQHLSPLEILSLFRDDIAQNLVLLPLGVALLVFVVGKRARLPVVLLLGLTLISLFFVNFLALNNVGQFISKGSLVSAVKFGLDHPDLAGDYVSHRSLLKIACVSFGFVIAALLMDRAGRTELGGVRIWLALVSCATIALSLILMIMGFFTTLPVPGVYRSATERAVTALLRPETSDARYAVATATEIESAFRELTHTSQVQSWNSPFFGQAARANIVVFILETAPARSFDPLRDKETAEPIADLLHNSFIAQSHYSTYPYTSEAVFSIFSGLYSVGIRSRLVTSTFARSIGWVDALTNQGYERRTYAPFADTFENDERMLALVGFSKRYVPNEAEIAAASDVHKRVASILRSLPASAGAAQGKDRARLEDVLDRDLLSWQTLKQDVATLAKNHQPFVVSFLPQLGHGPWMDTGGDKSVPRRGQRLIGIQLAWLKELVEQLRQSGTLDNTLILVTGDHGIRTNSEDPDFVPTAISDYSFHVPFVLYAPMVLRESLVINEPTSHVDIAPTMLALLGLRNYRWPLHGLPLWSGPALDSRSLFLFGGKYFGSDGLRSNGRFYSCSVLSEICFTGTSLPFKDQNPLSPAQAETVFDTLASIEALQGRTAQLLLNAEGYASAEARH